MRRIIDYKILSRIGYNPVIYVTLDNGSVHQVDYRPSTMQHFVAACSMLQFPYVQYDPSLKIFRVISNTRLEAVEAEEGIGNEVAISTDQETDNGEAAS